MRYYHYVLLVLAFFVTCIHHRLWWVSLLLVATWAIVFWLTGVAHRRDTRPKVQQSFDDTPWWKLR